jgi:hypothetical protein
MWAPLILKISLQRRSALKDLELSLVDVNAGEFGALMINRRTFLVPRIHQTFS